MKASQLRAASQFIEALDQVNQDLDVVEKGKGEPLTVRGALGQIKYKPPRNLYKEFLVQRRITMITLLQKMGVDVNG